MLIRLTAVCVLILEVTAGCAVRHAPGIGLTELEMASGGSSTTAEFERLVSESMSRAGVSGLSVAIINDRAVVHTRQFGWKDKDAATGLDENTVFAGGSLGKPVLAYLALLLADEGLLDLDRPLHEYLPRSLASYPGYADLGNDERHRSITTRMVLSHTSGLPNLRSATAGGRLRTMFPPGSRFSYSGEGFRLLQLVVEVVGNADVETLARERVFTPLGMSHTSFVWQERFADNVAAPHNEFEWAAEPDRPAPADAAGSLLTTARDYARFLAALLAAEAGQRTLVRRMWTPQVRITSARMFGASDRSIPAGDSTQLSWTLGWGAFVTPHGTGLFHTGHKAGYQSYAVALPDRGIGMVLLANSDNFESVAAEIVAAGIGDRSSPFEWLGYEPFDPTKRKPVPPRLRAIRVPATVIAPLAGVYQFGPGAVVHVRVEGDRLYASDDGQSWDELLAQSESVFFFKGRTITVTFVRDASGRVVRLELDNNGAKLSAERIR